MGLLHYSWSDSIIPQIAILFERAQSQTFSASVTTLCHLFNPQTLPSKTFFPIPNSKQKLRKQIFSIYINEKVHIFIVIHSYIEFDDICFLKLNHLISSRFYLPAKLYFYCFNFPLVYKGWEQGLLSFFDSRFYKIVKKSNILSFFFLSPSPSFMISYIIFLYLPFLLYFDNFSVYKQNIFPCVVLYVCMCVFDLKTYNAPLILSHSKRLCLS